MSLSAHRPWRSRLRRWPQPGGRTPTFRSTLRALAPCEAWGNPGRAASCQGCSAARRWSARHGTCTGTYSWGERSARSDRQNHPRHTHRPHELEGGRYKRSWITPPALCVCVIRSVIASGGGTLTNTDSRPLADVFGVVTPQPFTRVAGAHVRARLPPLTGTHQAAGAVVQHQGHTAGTHGGLLWTLTSTRTVLGPGWRQHLKNNTNKWF